MDLHLEPVGTPAAETTTRTQLLALIDDHGGNLSAVARALTTSRSQLHRLMQRHAIEPHTDGPLSSSSAAPSI